MQDAASSHPDAAAHYRYRSAAQIDGSFATLSSRPEFVRRMGCGKMPALYDPCPAKVSGYPPGVPAAMLKEYSSETCVESGKKIWTFVWNVALKADGYVILSAHESVPCDEIFKPLVSCRTVRRSGSPVPDGIVRFSLAHHPAWSIASGHFIRPPAVSSPRARVPSVPGRPMWSRMHCAGGGDAAHHRGRAFAGDGEGRFAPRNSRYGAIQPSLVFLNVVSSVGLHAMTNRTPGRHASSGCPADR